MFKNLRQLIKKNFVIFSLIILIFITTFWTSYYNNSKNYSFKAYNNFIDNVYLKKTLNHFVENLEPKFKKIKHKVRNGETFDKILENYSIKKKEIIKIKKSLEKKVNLNQLNTKQIIQFTLDKTNDKIDEFIYQISNTQKIFLKRNTENDIFDEKLLSIKLDKEVIYKENIITDSLYKSASKKNIPANTIVEFAGIYGFQVIFKEILERKINFK